MMMHTGWNECDPTPQEIAERCEAIQRGWSDDEKLRRRYRLPQPEAVKAARWTVPEVSPVDLPSEE